MKRTMSRKSWTVRQTSACVAALLALAGTFGASADSWAVDKKPEAVPDPNLQAMAVHCARHKIVSAPEGAGIRFLDGKSKVIESLNATESRTLALPILGCDLFYFFVISPKGQKSMVLRASVVTDRLPGVPDVYDANNIVGATIGAKEPVPRPEA